MSSRTAEYRKLIEDLLNSGLLDEEERAVLRDMLARAERRMLATMPASEAAE